MIRFNIVLLLLVFILGSSCSNESKKVIAFMYPSKETKRYNKESKYFKDYCEKHGFKVIVKTSNYDEVLQIEQADSLIEEGVDLIAIIATNGNSASKIVSKAHDNDIPVIAYNRLITDSDVDFMITGNNDEIGRMMVKGCIDFKDYGYYAIIGGDYNDINGIELQNSIIKHLDPYLKDGKMKLIYQSFTDNWNPTIAAFESEKIISLYGDSLSAIISGYDGMATAIIEVLKKHKMEGKIALTGQDAELDACLNVKKGLQTMTVLHPLKTIAEEAAKVAIAIVNNEEIDNTNVKKIKNGRYIIPVKKINSIYVDKNNLESVLVKSGFYTKEQLGL